MVRSRVVLTAVVLLLLFAIEGSVAQGLAGRDDIWADFERNDLKGLQPIHGPAPYDYIERDIQGVHCLATDGTSGKHWLCFDVPRDFLTGTQPQRYTLIIKYLDDPANGLVTVRYHGARDPIAQAIRFQRQGTGEWRELVLTLPDAVFLNGTMGVADFAVHGFTDTGDPRAADVFVSGVWLSKRVLEVFAQPEAIPVGLEPAKQTCTVRALAYAATGGLAPDGTVIRFSATGGTIGAEAPTKQGVAEAEFTSDGAAGTATVSADWDIVTGWTTIAKVPGDQPLQEGKWPGETFEEAVPADLERANAGTSFADVIGAEGGPGGKCLQIHYCFNVGAPGQSYVTYPLALPVPGRPRSISIWAKGDGSPHHFQLILQDAQNTMYTTMPVGRVLRLGWQEMSLPVDAYDDCWGPGADGVIDFPVTIVGARFVCLGGNQLEGDIYLDQITAQGLFPPEALGQPAEANVGTAAPAPRTPDGLLVPAGREPLGYIVENLVAIQDPNQLYEEVMKLRATPAGRDPEAIAGYKHLVELQPAELYHRYNLAALLFRAKDFAGALVQVDASLKEPSAHENWAHLLRARTLDELGRREEASKEYAALAKAFPNTSADSQWFHRPGVIRVWTEACRQAVNEPIPFHKRAPNASPECREITDLSLWVALSSRTQEICKFAIDRNPETFWAIGGDQRTGDWFQIDLGEVVLDVARIVLDDDGGANIYPWDLPGEMRIEGSVDDAKWEPLGLAHGDPSTVIDVTWPPRPLRYLRATLTENTPKRQFVEWRIYEAYVYQR